MNNMIGRYAGLLAALLADKADIELRDLIELNCEADIHLPAMG